jgi:hypothetical protein
MNPLERYRVHIDRHQEFLSEFEKQADQLSQNTSYFDCDLVVACANFLRDGTIPIHHTERPALSFFVNAFLPKLEKFANGGEERDVLVCDLLEWAAGRIADSCRSGLLYKENVIPRAEGSWCSLAVQSDT